MKRLALPGGPIRLALLAGAFIPVAGIAQQPPQKSVDTSSVVVDSVIERIRRLGTDSSRIERLSQVLLDSVGPRLTGTDLQRRASEWLVHTYESWQIPARNEHYGTWRGWRRGPSHLDLIAPRIRSLEATLVGYSPGTNAPLRARPIRAAATGTRARVGPPRDIEADVMPLPDAPDSASFIRALSGARGAFVLAGPAEPTCRPLASWQTHARPEALRAVAVAARQSDSLYRARLESWGLTSRALSTAIEAAGAAGILVSAWTGASGTNRIYSTRADRIPSFAVSCEDYALLGRLAAAGQRPRVRARADAEITGDVPVANTIAELKGTARPLEYVILSAHFDSYDGASGATDNGTGTVIVMEAMRLLRQIYPAPKRTIIAGHWVGEENGLIGSRAWAADHPEIVNGIHVVLNHDAGTGRVERVSMNGFARAQEWWRRWLARIPAPYANITLDSPGLPSSGSSDHSAFVCHGAPGFYLASVPYDYGSLTWHTNRDTFDKLDLADVRHNAILLATLAYLAAEDPEPMARDRADLGVDQRTGEARKWPECPVPPRSWAESLR